MIVELLFLMAAALGLAWSSSLIIVVSEEGDKKVRYAALVMAIVLIFIALLGVKYG